MFIREQHIRKDQNVSCNKVLDLVGSLHCKRSVYNSLQNNLPLLECMWGIFTGVTTATLFLSLSRLDQSMSEFGEMQMNKWYLPMSLTDYTHWSLPWLFRFSKMTGSDLPYHLCLLQTIFWTFRIITLFQCHLWKLLIIWTLLRPLQLSPAARHQNFLLTHQAKMWVQSSF